MNRRTFLKIIAGASTSLCVRRPLFALGEKESDEFFVFIHAAGGWDVMLWADPRNERKGLIEPPSTDNTDVTGLKHWKRAALDADAETFEILAPSDSTIRFGPAIGDLYDLRDRLTIVNGLEMNTVSHPDGIAYSISGRHLQGGKTTLPSLDVIVGNEWGTSQIVPVASVQFPSSFTGDTLNRRAIPLRMTSAATFAKSLSRSSAYLSSEDRADITALLTAEAHDLSHRSALPTTYDQFAGEFAAQTNLVGGDLGRVFESRALQSRYPMFDYKSKFHGSANLAAPFAIEAMKRNLVRCVAFSLGGLDTHNDNYKQHARILQDLFGTVATLLKQLDETPHPTRASEKLSDHTHVLVFSDFCRTPQITVTGGRDHYPNNSAVMISPRFKPGVFGMTDLEQLLPVRLQGHTSLTPPDLLATFVSAFGVDHRRYFAEANVRSELIH